MNTRKRYNKSKIVSDIPVGDFGKTRPFIDYYKSSTAPVLIPRMDYDKTYRSAYYNRFFNKPVTLLENNPMYQVYVNDVSQFFEYVGIHSKSKKKYIYPDCFLHTLFSIGLRNITQLRYDVSYLYNNKAHGVSLDDVTEYLSNVFGLRPGSVTCMLYHTPITDIPINITSIYNDIIGMYAEWLKNNYATIMYIKSFNIITRTYHTHVINVFNYNYEIWFFDPQYNVITRDMNDIMSSNETTRRLLKSYGVFIVKNIIHPKKVITNTCDIRFS